MVSIILILSIFFRVTGNPLICGPKATNNCTAVFPEPLSLPPNGLKGFCYIAYLGLLDFSQYSTLQPSDEIFKLLDLWFHRSIRLWDKKPSCGCCFGCKLWCCFFCHNCCRLTCLVALQTQSADFLWCQWLVFLSFFCFATWLMLTFSQHFYGHTHTHMIYCPIWSFVFIIFKHNKK